MAAAVPLYLLRYFSSSSSSSSSPPPPPPPLSLRTFFLSIHSCSRVLRAQASATTTFHLSRRTRFPTHFDEPHHTRSFIRHISSSVDEENAARAAAVTADSGGPTIFDKIIAKEIPSSVVYEDDLALAFRDIGPQAPVHVLVIPKARDGLTELGKAETRHEQILGHLLYVAKLVAEKEGIVDGFRVVINSGAEACQSVYHLHLHVLGGRQMKWPPG